MDSYEQSLFDCYFSDFQKATTETKKINPNFNQNSSSEKSFIESDVTQ